MRGHSGSLKVSSLPSLHFFLFYDFFFFVFFLFFFYLKRRRCQKKALEMEVQKQEGINESQK